MPGSATNLEEQRLHGLPGISGGKEGVHSVRTKEADQAVGGRATRSHDQVGRELQNPLDIGLHVTDDGQPGRLGREVREARTAHDTPTGAHGIERLRRRWSQRNNPTRGRVLRQHLVSSARHQSERNQAQQHRSPRVHAMSPYLCSFSMSAGRETPSRRAVSLWLCVALSNASAMRDLSKASTRARNG